MKAEDVVADLEQIARQWDTNYSARGGGFERKQAAAIRVLIAERDALRTLLATARAHMLGAGDGYENEVIVAIDAALGDKP